MPKKNKKKKIAAPKPLTVGDRVRVIAASDETPEMVGKVGVLKEIDADDPYPYLVRIEQVEFWAQEVKQTKHGAPEGNQNAIGNTGGRPTKYDPSYKDLLVAYFDVEPMRQVVKEASEEHFKDGTLKKKATKFHWMPNKMPTLYRFAKSIGVTYTTMLRWTLDGDKIDDETKEPIDRELFEFCSAYKEAKELQKEFLTTIGLAGAAPSAYAIFASKNYTDMRDRSETDLTSGGKPLGVIMMPAKQPPTPPPDNDNG